MTKRFGFLHIMSALIFSAALACTVDLASAFFAAQIPFVAFVLVFVISTVAIIALKISTRWLWLFYFVIMVASACVLGAVLFFFNNNAGFKAEDNGKELLYGGKKVLVLSSDEGDAILAAGGIVEEYEKYGSEISFGFYADAKNSILNTKADVIIYSETENFLFEEAMEQILKTEGNDYQPIILKANSDHLQGAEDFYVDNILSTVSKQGDWDNRLRLPVNGDGLSRSIYGCELYKQLKELDYEELLLRAEALVNGDKIFWIRDSHSLSYTADIFVSSGNGTFLNDFKLGGTWTPNASDGSKTATVTLAQPSYVQTIRLYDDPDESVNILNACISFDDGSTIQTGPLKESAATDIRVNKENVSSFTVQLLSIEGEGAGLTELEVYSYERDYGFNFIKLCDMKGNFVYDYYSKKIGTEQLKIYAPGVDEFMHVESIRTKPNGQVESGMDYNLKNGDTINISCRKDETLTLIVRSESGKYSDTVVITNPDRFMRQTGPAFEELFRHFFTANMQRSNCFTII